MLWGAGAQGSTRNLKHVAALIFVPARGQEILQSNRHPPFLQAVDSFDA
jgi:hypothetical protein